MGGISVAWSANCPLAGCCSSMSLSLCSRGGLASECSHSPLLYTWKCFFSGFQSWVSPPSSLMQKVLSSRGSPTERILSLMAVALFR